MNILKLFKLYMPISYEHRKRIRYCVADPENHYKPVWKDSFEGYVLIGLAFQELVDAIDWMTYHFVFDLRYKDQAEKKFSEKNSAVIFEFVPDDLLLKRAQGRRSK